MNSFTILTVGSDSSIKSITHTHLFTICLSSPFAMNHEISLVTNNTQIILVRPVGPDISTAAVPETVSKNEI